MASKRRREMTVRIALGAGRWQLFHQLMIESLLMSVAGGIAGFLLAYWGVPAIIGMLPPGFPLPRRGEIAVDLQSAPGPALGGITITSENAAYSLAREPGSRVLRASLRRENGKDFHPLFPAGPDEIIDVLDEEMSRSSKDNIYLRALGKIEALL